MSDPGAAPAGLKERRVSGARVEIPPSGAAPTRAPLEGRGVRLELLDPMRHAADLFAASHGDAQKDMVWIYLPYGPFENVDAFAVWLGDRARSDDPLFYAVHDRASAKAKGMASYLNIEPEHGTVEIGHIWFGPALQNTRQSTEALYLLMAHVFDDLRYRRLEWKCNALNEDSRRAALRLGFEFEGIFYQHRVVKGRTRDTAWYSLLDYEWPVVKANFERWLGPENFDQHGVPRESLRELNAALRDRGR